MIELFFYSRDRVNGINVFFTTKGSQELLELVNRYNILEKRFYKQSRKLNFQGKWLKPGIIVIKTEDLYGKFIDPVIMIAQLEEKIEKTLADLERVRESRAIRETKR
jgi:hypothetical protein